MTEPDVRRAVTGFLRRSGLLAPGHADPELIPLAGGVSSDLWRADLPSGPVCVKSALPQLKVARQWLAPTSRNRVEYEWLRFAQPLAPGQIPRVLAHDEQAGLFAMEFLPPEQYPVWKTLLLAGQVDAGAARDVGALTGTLHAASALDTAAAAMFATDENFDALRITPYLRVTAQAHPDLRQRLADLAARTAGTHLTVVHGDVSPKNILLGPYGPVLLDAECAWYGDPAFDVAFCINHLLIKSVRMPTAAAVLRASVRALAHAHARHVRWEPADHLDSRVASLTPALALARVDGSSPVEYLSPAQRATVRLAGRSLLIEPPTTVSELVDRWAVLTVDRKESLR
jgi:aminoglycoside phosphotransferase (APT) family kinase protein